MKRLVLLVAFGMVLGASGALARQVDEAQMAEALDKLGALLGLPPIGPEELERKVEEIGGLRFKRDVPVSYMTRAELARYIRELFEEEYPEELAKREERALRAFGFLEDGQDLRKIREAVLNENIAGFYDERPGVKKLFAISSGGTLNVMNQLILSHELRHAIQDQYVVIRDKLTVESDYDDRRLAALCLFEGDASVLMERYLTAGARSDAPELQNLFQVFSQSMTGADVAEMFGAGPALKLAPPVVQEQLVAPYFQGRTLAMAAFERGGFELLNQLLYHPPRSMEQVLHPEKYLNGGDEPLEVALPEIEGKRVDFEGRLGELLIQVLLRNGAARTGSVRAAAGWGGDHYAVIEDGATYTSIWRSVWDTRDDARELERALRTHMDDALGRGGYFIRASGREVVFERTGIR